MRRTRRSGRPHAWARYPPRPPAKQTATAGSGEDVTTLAGRALFPAKSYALASPPFRPGAPCLPADVLTGSGAAALSHAGHRDGNRAPPKREATADPDADTPLHPQETGLHSDFPRLFPPYFFVCLARLSPPAHKHNSAA